jgi:hypothetical protein
MRAAPAVPAPAVPVAEDCDGERPIAAPPAASAAGRPPAAARRRSPEVHQLRQDLRDRPGHADVIALAVVDGERAQALDDRVAADELRDRLRARALGDLHERAHDELSVELVSRFLMNSPTDKIPECTPHMDKGLHLKLYRFSPEDYKEIVAGFNGPHPETGEPLAGLPDRPLGGVATPSNGKSTVMKTTKKTKSKST